jgi:hypothetical protein
MEPTEPLEEVIEGERTNAYERTWSEGGIDYLDAVEILGESRTLLSDDGQYEVYEVTQRIRRTSSGVTWHDATQSVGSGGSWEETNRYKARRRRE